MRIFQLFRKAIPFNLIISLAILLPFQIFLLSQEIPQEKVLVKAYPLYVRVYHNGELVKDLKKEDFEIYENGVKKEIKGFEIVSRKISSPAEKVEEKPRERLFILIFNVFDYDKGVEEGIDYFFKNIYKKDDDILIVVENRLLLTQKGKNVSELSKNLKDALRKYKKISSQAISRAFMSLKTEADRLYMELQTGGGMSGGTDILRELNRFLENYNRIWEEYRTDFIHPHLPFYRGLINRIKPLKGEKWAIVFQQRELFPRLKNYGRIEFEIRKIIDESSIGDPFSRNLYTNYHKLQRSFDISYYPWETLKNIFMEENITYHILLLSSKRDLIDEDFELKEVSLDYEACLKDLSFSTGGSTIFSNKTSDSLKEIEQKEDFYFLLWFTPSEVKGERKVEVRIKREGVKVFYAKQISEIETPQVKISDFKAGNRAIEFNIVNFKIEKIEGKLKGIVAVKVTLYDENSNIVFSERKELTAFKNELHISLKFNTLKSGNYFAIIEVMDKIANGMDVFSGEIKL